MCRAGVSFTEETCTIVLTNPICNIGNAAGVQVGTARDMQDIRLARHLNTTLFHHLRFLDGASAFSNDDPVPDDDEKYGAPL